MIEENEDSVYLTGAEVSKILGLSRQTLLALRKKGALEGYKQGSKLLYCAENVRAFLNNRTTIIKLPIGAQQ
jgi:excisionase family DNA binding protein